MENSSTNILISLFILFISLSFVATNFATKITYIVQQQSNEKCQRVLTERDASRNGLQCSRVSKFNSSSS